MEKKYIEILTHSPRNLSWSHRYYKNGDIILDYSLNSGRERKIFIAYVEDSWQSYEVVLKIEDDLIISHECNCYYHTRKNACGHVLCAGYFYCDFIQEYEELNDFDIDSINLMRLKAHNALVIKKELDFSRDLFTEGVSHDVLDFELKLAQGRFHLEFEIKEKVKKSHAYLYGDYMYGEPTEADEDSLGELSVALKIGDEKMYVVKSIPNLLSSIRYNRRSAYGKFLTLVHDISIFDQATQDVLPLLQSMVSSEVEVSKEFQLTSENYKKFFELFSKLPREYTNTSVNEEPLVVDIDVEVMDDFYNLSLTSYIPYDSDSEAFYQVEKMKGKNYLLTRFVTDSPLVHKVIGYLTRVESMLVDEEMLRSLKRALHGNHDIRLIGTEKFDGMDIEGQKLYIDVQGDKLELRLKLETSQGEVINLFDTDQFDRIPQESLHVYNQLLTLNHERIDDALTLSLLDAQTFHFLELGLEFLKDSVDVYASDSLKNISRPTPLSINIGIKLKSGLLEVDVNSLQVSSKDLNEVLKQYKRKKKYHRLANGTILNLQSKDLADLAELTERLKLDYNKLQSKQSLPLFRAFQLEQGQKQYDSIEFNADSSLANFTQRFEHSNIEDIKLVKRFDSILKPYQILGVKWLTLLAQSGLNGILADDMGLGKTIQVIAYLEGQKRKQQSLIVCPASLMYNWAEEFIKFNSPLKVLCISGNQSVRENLVKDIENYDVIVTTYDYIRQDEELYKDIQFESFIIDEAQYIKNPTTKTAKTVKGIQSFHRIALSGTPIENRLSELWSIFDFLMPGYLYNYSYFRKHFDKPISIDKDEKAIAGLKSLVEPFILRRTKKEVLSELPDKLVKVLGFDFNDQEKEIYQAKLAQGNQEVGQILGMEKPDKLQILKILGELRQICCDPRLLFEGFDKISTKMKGCLEIIDSVMDRQEKVLIFSSFTSTLDLLEESLVQHGIPYFKLTGSTSKEERRRLIHLFQNDETPVFLMSLKAAGVGLNLTVAQNVIHFDPWWNVSAENQATDRAHRIGQESAVNVYKLIMRDSIEEKIVDLQAQKQELSDIFIEGSTGSFASMSKDDILDLFR